MSEHFISLDDAENDLLEFAAYKAESINSSDGHAAAMSAVLPLFLEKNDVDLAAELANTVDDSFTRDKLLIATAEKCAELDDDDYALQLADSIEEPGGRAQGLERIGTIKASKGQTEAALKIAEGLSHADPIYSAVALKEHSRSRENFDMAIANIADPFVRVHALLTAATEALSSDDPQKEEIERLIDMAEQDVPEVEHHEERIRSLIEIGVIWNDAGSPGRAIQVLDKAREEAESLENVYRDGFLSGVSVGFLRSGSQDLADRALDLVTDKTQLSNTLLGHSRIYWDKDQKDDALEALDEAYEILRSQKEKETRSSGERFKLFGSIAAQNASFDRTERAIEIADIIDDDAERTSALVQLAAIFSLAGKADDAKHCIDRIKDPASITGALIAVSDAAYRAGDAERSLVALDQAFTMADTVAQPGSRTTLLTEIAERFCGRDEKDKGREAADMAFDTIFTLKDESNLVVLLAELSRVFEAAGFEPNVSQHAIMGRSLHAGS